MSLFTDIIARLFSSKKPVPTPLRTSLLAELPARAREEAFFSAAVEDARILESMQARIAQELAMVTNGGGTMSSGRFVAEMKEILGAEPTEGSGSLTDITSHSRLQLIHDFQIQRFHSLARFVQNTQDEDMRDLYPAQELIRTRIREKERDWPRRWADAGGQFYGPENRMIATVADPIWTDISAFGTPYPPFDFNSGMGIRGIKRSDAEALGVIAPGEKVPAPDNPLNAPIQASAATLGPQGTAFLEKLYGSDLEIKDGLIVVNRPIATANSPRKGYHEWSEEEHPRDEDGKFTASGQAQIGKKSLDIAIRRKADVRRAMMHNELGQIDFEWGRPGNPKPDENGKTHRDGYGLSHILAKHGKSDYYKIHKTIAHGTIVERDENAGKVKIENGRNIVILSKKSPKNRTPWNDRESPRKNALTKRKNGGHWYVSTAGKRD